MVPSQALDALRRDPGPQHSCHIDPSTTLAARGQTREIRCGVARATGKPRDTTLSRLGSKTSTSLLGMPQPVDASIFTGETCSRFFGGSRTEPLSEIWTTRAHWDALSTLSLPAYLLCGGLRWWAQWARPTREIQLPLPAGGPRGGLQALAWSLNRTAYLPKEGCQLACVKGITAVALTEESSWQERFAPHEADGFSDGHRV